MTKAQEKAVENFRLVVQRHNIAQEIKMFEVIDGDDYVTVNAISGLKGDEGRPLLEMIRDRVMIYIGKRGGITYPVIKDGRLYKKRYECFYKLIGDQLYMWD